MSEHNEGGGDYWALITTVIQIKNINKLNYILSPFTVALQGKKKKKSPLDCGSISLMVNEYLLFLEMNKTMSGCCMVLCINGLPLHFPSHQLPPSRSERNIPSFCSGCREDTHSLWKGLGEGESTTFPNPVIKLVKNPKGPTLYLDH